MAACGSAGDANTVSESTAGNGSGAETTEAQAELSSAQTSSAEPSSAAASQPESTEAESTEASEETEETEAEPEPVVLTAEERLTRFKDSGISGFVRTDGQLLVDENGDQYLMKGMAMGNLVWDNGFYPPSFHHDEESYAELKELGFNCVRFYLNYGLFERDFRPYTYSQSGWDWLDENIEWAGKHGIRLILNMHYPQGGFQSYGDGMQLWQDPECQNRLTALWTAIAERYKDEPVVLGYDLLNEPIVPKIGSVEQSFAQWENLAGRIVDAIREVDTNHIIIVERLNAIKDTVSNTMDSNPNFNGDMNYFLIDDDNVVYEFHDYNPFAFTHQDDTVVNTAGMVREYPDEDSVSYSNAQYAGLSEGNPSPSMRSAEWQYLEGNKITVNNEAFKLGEVTFRCGYIGTSGKVYCDDLVVTEFDENGEVVREMSFPFDNTTSWVFWAADGVGSGGYSAYDGRDGGGCLFVEGTVNNASLADYNNMFAVKQGYSYQISGWVRVVNIGTRSNVALSVDFYNADNIMPLNKESLEADFVRYLEFGQKNNVPLYLGEFGVISGTFKEDRGGDRWVEDMLGFCKEYNVNFTYHAYHEPRFGLWTNSSSAARSDRNEILAEVFKKALAEE